MATTTLRQEFKLALLGITRPRDWHSFWVHIVAGLIVAAMILTVFAVVANDVPWTVMFAVLLIWAVFMTFGTVVRSRRSSR